jgi:hypothetical protein
LAVGHLRHPCIALAEEPMTDTSNTALSTELNAIVQQAKTMVFTDAMAASAELSTDALRLFPHGITSIKIEVKIDGLGSAMLAIDGPKSASGLVLDATAAQAIGVAAAPTITSVDPVDWARGKADKLTINGTNFTEPDGVDFPDTFKIVSFGPKRIDSTKIEVRIKVENECEIGRYNLEVPFKDGSTAKKSSALNVT